MALVLLTREGCMNTVIMRGNLDAALKALGRPPGYQMIDSATLANTDVRRGYPTPTLLFKNRDIFGMPEPRSPDPAAT